MCIWKLLVMMSETLGVEESRKTLELKRSLKLAYKSGELLTFKEK